MTGTPQRTLVVRRTIVQRVAAVLDARAPGCQVRQLAGDGGHASVWTCGPRLPGADWVRCRRLPASRVRSMASSRRCRFDRRSLRVEGSTGMGMRSSRASEPPAPPLHADRERLDDLGAGSAGRPARDSGADDGLAWSDVTAARIREAGTVLDVAGASEPTWPVVALRRAHERGLPSGIGYPDQRACTRALQVRFAPSGTRLRVIKAHQDARSRASHARGSCDLHQRRIPTCTRRSDAGRYGPPTGRLLCQARRAARPAATPVLTVSDSVDLVIAGGTIVDGTGAPGRPGTVVVEGDRMRVLPVDAPLPEQAGRTIDATGKVVAPGFIDLHSHGGLVILAEPRHEPKVRQGVTTEIVGVDGNGFAPFERREDLLAFVEFDSGLDGRPGPRLRLADGRRLPGPLRRHGQRQRRDARRQLAAADRGPRLGRRPADDARSTGCARSCARRWRTAPSASTGLDYPPGATPRPRSWPRSRGRPARLGGFYHTHVRYYLGDRFLDPFREAIEIGRRGEAPATSRTSTTARPTRAARSSCSPSSTTRAPRASTSPSTRTRPNGPAPAPHPAARLDPGRRARAAEGAPRRPRRPRPDPRRDRGRGAAYAGRAAGPTCASARSAGPSSCAGSRRRWPRS